jgi:hypothetical protein
MQERRERVLRCSPGLACMLFVLSLSLFSWGLHYKLSLYHAGQSQTKTAAAKLLSQKERPVRVAKITPPGGTAQDLTARASAVDCLSVAHHSEWGPPATVRTRRPFFSTHTGSRPPPARAA